MIPTIDITKKGGAWQTELRKAEAYADFEIVGKGAGTKYIVHEVYETPIEILHGNTRKHSNKGYVDITSEKYQLAEILIAMDPEVSTKKGLIKKLGLSTKNMEHAVKMFSKQKYKEMSLAGRFCFLRTIAIETAINRLIASSLELIGKGVFKNVELLTFPYVNVCGKFKEADDYYELIPLWEQAMKIVNDEIKREFGTIFFFTLKIKLQQMGYQKLLEIDDAFEELQINNINFFYDKYLVKNNNIIIEEIIYDENGERNINEPIHKKMFETFLKHYTVKKTEESLTKIDSFLGKIENADVKQGFNNEEELMLVTIKFIELLFENDSYEVFEKKYKQIVGESEGKITITDDQLPF